MILAYEGKKEVDREELKDSFKVIDFKTTNKKTEKNNLSYSNDMEEELKGITLRKDGLYMIRKTIGGKTYTKYARTINEAKKERTRLCKINQDTYSSKNISLKNWMSEWLETCKKPFVSPNSYREICDATKRIDKAFKNLKLKDLNTNMLQKYMNSLEHNRTKEKTQTYFNALLQRAEDLELIKKNPFKGVIRDKKINNKNVCFSFDEQSKILSKLKDNFIEHEIYIYLLTGCRPNELPPSQNFDFVNNLITINGTKTEKSKKRVIEITPEFANYIKPYIMSNNRVAVKQISKEFKQICTELKIDKPILYRLRHTFASNHFILKTPAKQVQEWLGHSKITLTMDTYTDIDKTSSREKIQNLYKNFYFEFK